MFETRTVAQPIRTRIIESRRLLAFFLIALVFTWFFWMPDALFKMGLISASFLTGLGFWFYFRYAFQKMNPATTTDIIPNMPLTSLGDNTWPAGLLVVSMASPSKSAAKHMIIIPTTILSIFMISYFRRCLLLILCMRFMSPTRNRNGKLQ